MEDLHIPIPASSVTNPSAWASSGRMVHRMCGSFMNEVLPRHSLTIVRITIGVLYFWFGLLKFPFVPSHSSDEAIIRATWGLYFDPDLIILASGIFETGMGLLVLIGYRVKVLGALLIAHVLMTFLTIGLNPGYLVLPEYKMLSLSLAGQYVFKNVLILSSAIILITYIPRAHMRFAVRMRGSTVINGVPCKAAVRDISLGGISLLVLLPHPAWQSLQRRLEVTVQLPLTDETWTASYDAVHISLVGHEKIRGLCVGCSFVTPLARDGNMSAYLTMDNQVILKTMALEIPPARINARQTPPPPNASPCV